MNKQNTQHSNFHRKKVGQNIQRIRCPRCQQQTNSIKYYQCCLQPSCFKCYQSIHILQCKRNKSIKTKNDLALSTCATQQQNKRQLPDSPLLQKNRKSKTQSPTKLKKKCSSCQEVIKDIVYLCEQCPFLQYCKECVQKIHSVDKFKLHKTHAKRVTEGDNVILICQQHKKQRNIITQSLQLVCTGCVTDYNLKKLKVVNKNNTPQRKQSIKILTKDLLQKNSAYQNKWKQLRHKIDEQYRIITDMVKDRYQYCLSVLDKIVAVQSKIFNDSKNLCQKTKIQIDLMQTLGNQQQKVQTTRIHLLAQQLNRKKKVIKSTENYIHKISQIDKQKFQALLKGFCIQKQKIKQDQIREKQNSLRKSQRSISKSKNQDLTLSRKSLLDSSNKLSNSRMSSKSIMKPTINQNSSGKKSMNNIYKSSSFASKMEDIQPMALNFESNKDLHQSNKSKITFLCSSKTQNNEKNLQDSTDLTSISTTIGSRPNKRKSDYFDLRERMRKPSMINNRFNRK